VETSVRGRRPPLDGGHAPADGVGERRPRSEGPDKVRGSLRYVADLVPPRSLWVAVARSERPHASLIGVDTAGALASAGVAAVVTGADLWADLGERMLTGPAFQDQPVLAVDRVRYVGEPLAAVVAADLPAARGAAGLIRAGYEDLPAALDLEAALAEATFVHDELRPSAVFGDLRHMRGKRGTNVCYDFRLRSGDPEAALDGAAVVVEGEFWCPPTHHVPMELPCTHAWVEAGRLELVTTTQTPSYVRQMAADLLGLPLSRVRVRTTYLGGSYGSKMYSRLEPLAAAIAWRLRRPVSLVASREESFLLTTRHGAAVGLRLGGDGRGIVGAVADVRYDTGAYADIGPRIAHKSGLVSTGPYDIPNVAIRSRCVYTNKPSAGPFRGFGVPQVVWAHESLVDELARRCGQDPYRFRRDNLLREGDVSAVGTAMHSADLVGCLDAVAGALDWTRPLQAGDGRLRRGRGIAVGLKAVLTPTISGAVLQLNQDGSASLLISTVDMGQGSDTIMAQIVAEVLAIPAAGVRVVQPDTDVTPYDTITAGSRSTYHMGNAVREAAERMRAKLAAIAAKRLGVSEAEVKLTAEGVHAAGFGRPVPLAELLLDHLGSRGTTLVAEAEFQTSWTPYDPETGRSPEATEHWFAGAVGAQVLVDTDSGHVRIEHLAVAGDVGRAINPTFCEQQLVGAALMGIGHALFDELVFADGQLVNGTFLEYQVPSIKDLPARITPLVIESPHRGGPFGAKGVGETGILATAPAIGNAIRDATGVRLRRLPMTPERVLSALSGEEPS
jgi:CO/xanthine dehydrogenase Mo-binding subunit